MTQRDMERMTYQQLDALLLNELNARCKEEFDRMDRGREEETLYGTERHARAFDAYCEKIACGRA